MPEEEKITLEEGFAQLDEITRKMEEPQMPLEERFDLYKKGMELVKICTAKIDTVEKSLKTVADDGHIEEAE